MSILRELRVGEGSLLPAADEDAPGDDILRVKVVGEGPLLAEGEAATGDDIVPAEGKEGDREVAEDRLRIEAEGDGLRLLGEKAAILRVLTTGEGSLLPGRGEKADILRVLTTGEGSLLPGRAGMGGGEEGGNIEEEEEDEEEEEEGE